MTPLPPSHRMVETRLPPGTHFTRNGGKLSYVATGVRHEHRAGQWVTVVEAKLYANRRLTDGGATHMFWPVRVIDGCITILYDNGSYLQPITPAMAERFEADLRLVRTEV